MAAYDGAQMLVYVDGTLRESRVNNASLVPVSAHAIVGENSTGKGWFQGTMDELAIYDRALPAETIAAHHALGSAAPP